MDDDRVEALVIEAHQIFGMTSIYEVMDLDRDTAIKTLAEFYGPADQDKIDKYLSILDELREDEEPSSYHKEKEILFRLPGSANEPGLPKPRHILNEHLGKPPDLIV